ncbi:hypothetical protein [Streptomyces platensis]|uniref:hypothetical protein n=1 Tax=Streptomyces platensis TaxID=58346 RepID=UPI001F18C828|nr:hypothetical protein [Streptomyces platensis]MCF3142416.1 hypothetical protein [Streptomyces platensis]
MEPMEKDRRVPERYEPGEGCLTTAVRLPVRIVVLVLVVPVRLVWDAVAALGRAVHRTALRPLGRGLAWLWHTLVVIPVAWTWRTLVVAPLGWLWRSVLTPVGRGIAWLGRGLGVGLVWLAKALFVWPWVALWRYVVAPVGRGVAVVVAWLVRYLVVVPARWLYASVLTPVGRGIVWLVRGIGTVVATLVRWILVVPLVALWRYVLRPVGRALAAVVTVVVREVGAAFGHCWRVAGIISRAVGRFLGAVLRWVFVKPVRWVYRTVLTPLGHGIRNGIWRPARQALRTARETIRQTRQELRRALFGAPREPQRATAVPPRREPGAPGTRTLGSSTTALTKD